MSISIEKFNYNNQKDLRILEAVLCGWFKNPKELNWTDSRLTYPFKFKNWVNLYYSKNDIDSFVMKSNGWFIGIGNFILLKNKKKAHLINIFIDPEFRRKGFATQMLEYLEEQVQISEMKFISIRIMKKNRPALNLLKKQAFEKNGTSKGGRIIMEKTLVN